MRDSYAREAIWKLRERVLKLEEQLNAEREIRKAVREALK